MAYRQWLKIQKLKQDVEHYKKYEKQHDELAEQLAKPEDERLAEASEQIDQLNKDLYRLRNLYYSEQGEITRLKESVQAENLYKLELQIRELEQQSNKYFDIILESQTSGKPVPGNITGENKPE